MNDRTRGTACVDAGLTSPDIIDVEDGHFREIVVDRFDECVEEVLRQLFEKANQIAFVQTDLLVTEPILGDLADLLDQLRQGDNPRTEIGVPQECPKVLFDDADADLIVEEKRTLEEFVHCSTGRVARRRRCEQLFVPHTHADPRGIDQQHRRFECVRKDLSTDGQMSLKRFFVRVARR